MKKAQRYRLDMFVRVRDFGAANQALFPESSTGSQTFAQVAAAVAAVEDHLTKRDLARVEARRVKAATRAAVYDYMKTLARTAREVTKGDAAMNPFVLPAQRTAQALLAKARLFIDEAKPREARFVALGLPSAFLSEFTSLVNDLHTAVNVKNNGRALREKAQTGIEHALDAGGEAIRSLDVIVPNVLRDDPVRQGHWRGARRLEGVPSSAATPKVAPATAGTGPVVVTTGETLPKAS